MNYITLLAKLTAKPGCESQLLQELEAMVKPSRAETGCLKYVLHKLPDDDNVFWFVEEWKSKEALEQHTCTPHYLRLKERTASLIEQTELILLEPVA